jgi:hypothetical protein
MNDYIKEYKNSLSPEFCNHIIDVFKNEPNKHKGVVDDHVFLPHAKDTNEYRIRLGKEKADHWVQIEKHLFEELQSKLLLYMKHLRSTIVSYNYFKNIKVLTDDGFDFNIQEYTEKEGKYVYHHDGLINWKNQSSRVFSYIWYLNDVLEGGETEFFGNYKIKPEAGKLIFFPAEWTFPHCGCVPISGNKYIITGCFSRNTNKDIIQQIKNTLIDDQMKNELCDMKNELDALLNSIHVNEDTNTTHIGVIDNVVDSKKTAPSYGRIYKTE